MSLAEEKKSLPALAMFAYHPLAKKNNASFK